MIKKEEKLQEMNQALKALIQPEGDWLANLANSSALLFEFMDDINWAGYYIWKNDQLVLGPFQGKTACVRIEEDKGVCGTAYSQRKIMVVEDVHQFPGHIACDSNSKSEIVLPIIVAGEVIAVLDIDSPQKSRFDELDRKYLQEFVDILVDETDFLPLMEKF
ncbi:GAF domain-containing protein [Halanaerobium congolense]|uniref:GAF domain-containing protein n=1 Tax=Halanaerobium congolense TaxID=54121 RepID=A0A1G6JKG2_9FIRM|nr:GAF domain-containing protein [Halanaerobium congolense]PTX16205.1 GAF domain-containing protein [Halanaerobium congolense]PXV60141.1 GAF domain-containing protein [Halanaerobium congolense]SDC19151.1 GAF domain-containing protein [Halanaerobium congolense]SDF48576.1 GAF domain-containing protein [Halanaerobium congolense]SDH53064.1 GAF domain-containing protein [Halanaerobium congolense]